jgi:hypothetical protein
LRFAPIRYWNNLAGIRNTRVRICRVMTNHSKFST